MKMRVGLIVASFALLVCHLSAQTAGSVTANGKTMSWTVSGGSMTLTLPTMTGGVASPANFVAFDVLLTDAPGTQVFYRDDAGGGTVGSSPVTLTASTRYTVRARYFLGSGSTPDTDIFDPAITYKVQLTFDNQTGSDKIYRVMQNGVQVGEDFIVPAGTVAIVQVPVPSADTVSVLEYVTGLVTDGIVWQVAAEGDPVLVNTQTTTPTTEADPPPSVMTPGTNTGAPVAPVQGNSTKTIWASAGAGSTDGLTGQTFAEGVDKIVAAIEGSEDQETLPEYDGEPAEGSEFTPTVGDVTDIVGILPAAPVLPTSIGTSSSLSFPFKLPAFTGYDGLDTTITADFTSSAAAFATLRNVLLFCFGIAFFFAVVATLKSAFAS